MTEAVFAAEPTRLLIVALIRASVGAAVVAMTMAAEIMAAMPGVAELSPVYLAAMVCAINGGATAFSHVNDSGFWLVGALLEIDEKTTLDHDGNNYWIHRSDLCNCDQPVRLGEKQMIAKVVLGTMQNARNPVVHRRMLQ